MVADGVALIAEEDDKPVAYALARYGDHGPTTVYVSDLWVDSSARAARASAASCCAAWPRRRRAREHARPARRGLEEPRRARVLRAPRVRGGREDPARAARRCPGAGARAAARDHRRAARAERRCGGRRARRRASSCRGSCAARPFRSSAGETWTVVRMEPFGARRAAEARRRALLPLRRDGAARRSRRARSCAS